MENTLFVIPCRMNSTRLPGKAMMKADETNLMLDYTINQLSNCKKHNQIISEFPEYSFYFDDEGIFFNPNIDEVDSGFPNGMSRLLSSDFIDSSNKDFERSYKVEKPNVKSRR